MTGGRIRFDDWTVVGNNNLLGRIEVAGGEFSTREINLGFANQSAALTSVMEVTGGRVTLENNGADCYFQLGNGNTCFGHLRMTGGEVFAMCLRGNHNGSGSATAFFDGGRIAANKVHNNWALVHNLDSAVVGATGLTVDANGFSAWLNQEFTDADDGNGGTVDGVVRITGNGSVDIRKNSNHAKTVVDGGRMSFSNGATVFGRTVQLVNGGVYSLEGDATSFSFDHLVIGDATSAGVLKLDQGDTITITGADGLEVNNLVLDVSHMTANGSYAVFTTSGDGTIGFLVITFPLETAPHTQTGKSGGQVQGFSFSLNRFFTIRSSREWNVMIASLPPGFKRPIIVSMDESRTSSSEFTSIRSA